MDEDLPGSSHRDASPTHLSQLSFQTERLLSKPPEHPKLYHITHIDRLASIVDDGRLFCDSEVLARSSGGTTIGMDRIKRRRIDDLELASHQGLKVGSCVPHYFCPRSVMLYLIHRANHSELDYRGGQEPILHLQMDLDKTVEWAERNSLRWAFTLSNAGSFHFEDRCDLAQLDQIDWDSVNAKTWNRTRDSKQAEFLIERHVDWNLVELVGTATELMAQKVGEILAGHDHKPPVERRPDWYY